MRLFGSFKSIFAAALTLSLAAQTGTPRQKSTNALKPVKTPAQILRENAGAVAVIVAAGDKSTKLGTGFFLRPSGLLLTNLHVVEGTELVGVRVPAVREILWAENAKGFDSRNDLAVLEVQGSSVKTVALGDSNNIQVGEPIVVIGSPAGLEQTVSNGLISGIRELDGRRLFQITAPISGGSSGSPVFNQYGEVVGVVVASLESGQNLNFAIPINYAKALVQSSMAIPIATLPKKQVDSSTPSDRQIGYVDCDSFDFVTVFDSPDPSKSSTIERLRCWDVVSIAGDTNGQFTKIQTKTGLSGYVNSSLVHSGTLPAIPDNLPKWWKFTLSGQETEVRIYDNFLYEEAKAQGQISDRALSTETHCETKRKGTGWSGKCRYSFTWLGGPSGFTSQSCSVETNEVITSITATRIEGKSQPIDFSPMKQTPQQCPQPGQGWKEFAMIPRD